MIHPLKFRPTLAFLVLVAVASMLIEQSTLASNQRQDTYPPPVQETIESLPIETIPPSATALPYPPSDMDYSAATPIPIGVQSGAQIPQGNIVGDSNLSDQATQQTSDRGLLILWVGFIATLLIFCTSIIGALILFTRRNESR